MFIKSVDGCEVTENYQPNEIDPTSKVKFITIEITDEKLFWCSYMHDYYRGIEVFDNPVVREEYFKEY